MGKGRKEETRERSWRWGEFILPLARTVDGELAVWGIYQVEPVPALAQKRVPKGTCAKDMPREMSPLYLAFAPSISGDPLYCLPLIQPFPQQLNTCQTRSRQKKKAQTLMLLRRLGMAPSIPHFKIPDF